MRNMQNMDFCILCIFLHTESIFLHIFAHSCAYFYIFLHTVHILCGPLTVTVTPGRVSPPGRPAAESDSYTEPGPSLGW